MNVGQKILNGIFLLSSILFIACQNPDPESSPTNDTEVEIETIPEESFTTIKFQYKNMAVNDTVIIESNDTLLANALPFENGFVELELLPGKYDLFIKVPTLRLEINLDSIIINQGENDTILVNFNDSHRQKLPKSEQDFRHAKPKKPVIYFYPDKEMEIDFEIEFVGKMLFTYPFRNDNKWKILANPDGSFLYEGERYEYLFWEGEMNSSIIETPNSKTKFLDQKNLLPYLESVCKATGMNSKERNDFITYWVPLMLAHERVWIKFIFNDECDKIARFQINPKPDYINRIFMIWGDAGNSELSKDLKINLPEFKRGGFHILEWGGAKLETIIGS